MSLPEHDRIALAAKEHLTQDVCDAIDDATVAVVRNFQARGFKAKTDDRLARVEAAIVRYYLESQGAA